MSRAVVVLDGWALGRQRFGWYVYGWASHSFETIVITVFMSRYLPAVAQNAVAATGPRSSRWWCFSSAASPCCWASTSARRVLRPGTHLQRTWEDHLHGRRTTHG
jgi:MFS-type transporter involved in bile tolerance (Atg22 family)